MANIKYFSRQISVFHGRIPPKEGTLAGYCAIINTLELQLPVPEQLALITNVNNRYSENNWNVFPARYEPRDTLYDHLVFALKYEGINLLCFKKLFESIDESEIMNWISASPQSQYTRRIWFLFEWLMGKKLEVNDLKTGNYVLLADTNLQYVLSFGVNSSRHRIKNNLPGTADFCPMIRRTGKIDNYISENLITVIDNTVKDVSKDILLRTSSFLLLKDSKASFNIEGEIPENNRAVRWGAAIGQAGTRQLSKEELLRLQLLVLENNRFINMGFRTEGEFVGEHDRLTGTPLPAHISAKWQDLDSLISGLLAAADKMITAGFHPVMTAAVIAFGFVFIHPFVDGNGRLHRYLIHHILSVMKFNPAGLIFPVSAAMLDRIDIYRKVLESYSQPLLKFINWEKTVDNNVNVLNETADYYRYFDATRQAEFLYECVSYTVKTIIPFEIAYLQKYDLMRLWLANNFKMPDKMISLVIRFLEQNQGNFSKRAKEKEFAELTNNEAESIEKYYKSVFNQ
jgi:hypothetical protein